MPYATRTAIAATAANIAIHAYLTPMHLDELRYIGVLFIAGNVALAVALGLLTVRRTRSYGWLLLGSTAVVELLGYLASRTIGLPGGYLESWLGETEDALGILSLITDVVILAASAAWLRAGEHVPGTFTQLRGHVRRLCAAAQRPSSASPASEV